MAETDFTVISTRQTDRWDDVLEEAQSGWEILVNDHVTDQPVRVFYPKRTMTPAEVHTLIEHALQPVREVMRLGKPATSPSPPTPPA